MGEKLPDWSAAANLVRKIAENYRLPYYSLSPTYSVCKSHGYISGEKFVCPFCGERTEVYSRITGYYRPVQNWNDGKAEEYKNRKLYNIAASMAARADSFKAVNEAPVEEDTACDCAEELLLFATKTCPNCKMAEKFLSDAEMSFSKVYYEDNRELAEKYGIKQAPTLVVISGGNVIKIENASNIRKFIAEAKA